MHASVYKGARVQELINEVGALVRFLPAYSPDLNPIEVFAEVKGYMKANDGVFKATLSPKTFIHLAFSSVPKDNYILIKLKLTMYVCICSSPFPYTLNIPIHMYAWECA